MYRRNEQIIREPILVMNGSERLNLTVAVTRKPHHAVLVFSTASGMENITNMVYKRLAEKRSIAPPSIHDWLGVA